MADLVQAVKNGYDRFLLLVAGLLLAASAVFTAWSLGGLREAHQLPQVRPTGALFEPSEAVEQLRQEASRLNTPPDSLWEPADASLFVSRIYLLRDGELVDILESDTELYPGIPNEWIIEHDLDYTDPQLGERDADGDGFTNLEEFRAGTNPRDPTSKPALWTKLRVKSFEKIPFRMKFMGAPDVFVQADTKQFPEDTLFSINTLDFSSPTQFLRIGDTIEGTDLKIISARPKAAVSEQGVLVDLSELTVRDGATGDEIILINEREVDSPYSFALLDYPITSEEIRVEKGKTFELAPNGEAYKLIDVDTGGAVISPVDSEGERLTVPPLE
jgi:hypothetical protein